MIREFRPLTIGGLFDAFLRVLFNKDSLRLMLVYLGLSLPILVFCLAMFSQAITRLFTEFLPASGFGDLGLQDLGSAFPGALALLLVPVYVFIGIAYTLTATDLYGKRFFETPYAFFPSFRSLLKKMPAFLFYQILSVAYFSSLSFMSYIIITVLTAVSIAFNDVTVTLIALFLSVVLVMAVMEAAGLFFLGTVPGLAIDRKGLFRSIGGSAALFAKDYFRILGSCLLFRFLMLVGSLFLTLSLIFVSGFILSSVKIGQNQMTMIALVMSFTAYGFTGVVMNIAGNAFQAVLYCNQKVKREGLGAELLARRFLEEYAAKGGTVPVP